jgi:hypothetical protein
LSHAEKEILRKTGTDDTVLSFCLAHLGEKHAISSDNIGQTTCNNSIEGTGDLCGKNTGKQGYCEGSTIMGRGGVEPPTHGFSVQTELS